MRNDALRIACSHDLARCSRLAFIEEGVRQFEPAPYLQEWLVLWRRWPLLYNGPDEYCAPQVLGLFRGTSLYVAHLCVVRGTVGGLFKGEDFAETKNGSRVYRLRSLYACDVDGLRLPAESLVFHEVEKKEKTQAQIACEGEHRDIGRLEHGGAPDAYGNVDDTAGCNHGTVKPSAFLLE